MTAGRAAVAEWEQRTRNGMVFTTRFAGGRAGRNACNGFEAELARHRIAQKYSEPDPLPGHLS